jgi:hypothetical protein
MNKEQVFVAALLFGFTVSAVKAQDDSSSTSTAPAKVKGGNPVSKDAKAVGSGVEKGGKGIVKDFEKGVKGVGKDLEKGVKGVGKETEKGVKGTEKGLEKVNPIKGKGAKTPASTDTNTNTSAK